VSASHQPAPTRPLSLRGERFLSLENAVAADTCIAMAQRCLSRRDLQISTRCPFFSRLVNRTHHAQTRSLLTSSAATHLRTQKTKQHSVCTVSTHLSSPLCPTPRDVDGTLSALSPSLSLSAASDRLLAAGEQVGSGTTTSERRGRREGRRAPWP